MKINIVGIFGVICFCFSKGYLADEVENSGNPSDKSWVGSRKAEIEAEVQKNYDTLSVAFSGKIQEMNEILEKLNRESIVSTKKIEENSVSLTEEVDEKSKKLLACAEQALKGTEQLRQESIKDIQKSQICLDKIQRQAKHLVRYVEMIKGETLRFLKDILKSTEECVQHVGGYWDNMKAYWCLSKIHLESADASIKVLSESYGKFLEITSSSNSCVSDNSHKVAEVDKMLEDCIQEVMQNIKENSA